MHSLLIPCWCNSGDAGFTDQKAARELLDDVDEAVCHSFVLPSIPAISPFPSHFLFSFLPRFLFPSFTSFPTFFSAFLCPSPFIPSFLSSFVPFLPSSSCSIFAFSYKLFSFQIKQLSVEIYGVSDRTKKELASQKLKDFRAAADGYKKMLLLSGSTRAARAMDQTEVVFASICTRFLFVSFSWLD